MGGGASMSKRDGVTATADNGHDANANPSANPVEQQAQAQALPEPEPQRSRLSLFRFRRKKKGDSSKSGQSSSSQPGTSASMGKLERGISWQAAILIQRWYRQYLARMEIRRRYTWNIFQSVEYAGEQDQMKLYNFFNALMTLIPQKPLTDASSGKPPLADAASVDSTSDVGEGGEGSGSGPNRSKVKLRKRKVFAGGSPYVELDDVQVENDYKGPHVKLPMTLQNLQELIDAFKSKKTLHVRYVAAILKAAALSLKRRPNMNTPSTALSKQITICGDLHGKLDDLFVIFYKNGLPSPENPYVFNGDYVDRGRRSMEILLILLSCFLLSPDAVYLNRGNHEDHIMNGRYGFIREVRLKYKVFAGKVLHLIDQVYRSLPLGTIIDGRVLVVHGGISATTDLKFINQIDRYKYVSILRPPCDEEGRLIQLSELYTSSSNSKNEWKQVLDLLWSDPSSGTGCTPNNLRGGGVVFGSDVTEKVLEKHGLQLLIRSHECKPEGYEFMHDNKCLTVFSASNYYEDGSNKGAYVRLVGGPSEALEPYFVQFNAATPKLKNMSIRQRVSIVESSALRELRSLLMERQAAIIKAFNELDNAFTGLVSVNAWCVIVEKETGLKLPWRLLRPRLADLDESGLVLYHSTFNVEPSPSQQEDVTVVDVLYRNKTSLETIFRIIDKDNSGVISMEEFSDACDLLGQHLESPIPQQQMTEMAKSMDLNGDGTISLNEFLETFRIVSTNMGGKCKSGEESLEYEEAE